MHSKVSLALGIKGVDWCIIVLCSLSRLLGRICWCVTIMAMHSRFLLAIDLEDV